VFLMERRSAATSFGSIVALSYSGLFATRFLMLESDDFFFIGCLMDARSTSGLIYPGFFLDQEQNPIV